MSLGVLGIPWVGKRPYVPSGWTEERFDESHGFLRFECILEPSRTWRGEDIANGI
jgi:hypothetical protein